MTKIDSNILRNRVLQTVSGLPAKKIHELIILLSSPSGEEKEKIEIVRQALIEHVNRTRRDRSRRLFTSLFEPFLVSDPVILRSDVLPPGMFHRMDIGCLWLALEKMAFPELARRVQNKMDDLAKNMLLNEALQTSEAVALREEMRKHAVQFLRQNLAERSKYSELISYINNQRLLSAPRLLIYPSNIYHLTPMFLTLIVTFLEDRSRFMDACEPVLAQRDCKPEAAGADHLTYVLAEAVRALGTADTTASLPVLWMLHVTQNFDSIGNLLRHGNLAPAQEQTIIECLINYLDIFLGDIIAVVRGALKLPGRAPGAPVRITFRERRQLHDDQERLRALLSAADIGGLFEVRATAERISLAWRNFLGWLDREILPVHHQRLDMVAHARSGDPKDCDDVIWLTQFIRDVEDCGRWIEPDDTVVKTWRAEALTDIRVAIDKALPFRDNEEIENRAGHLLRLNRLMKAFGSKASLHISVLSLNAIRIVEYCIRHRANLDTAAQEFMTDFLAIAETEVGRSRNWQSPELMDLVRLARECQLFTVPEPKSRAGGETV